MMKQVMQRGGLLLKTLTRQKLDAVDLLEVDHIKIEMLFLRWRLTQDRTGKEDFFEKIKAGLNEHMEFEETYFYPACEKISEAKEWLLDSREEHKQIRTLLKEITSLNQTSEKANKKMKALLQCIEHHVQDEENGLFPVVRSSMKKNVLERLNREILAFKQDRVSSQKTAA